MRIVCGGLVGCCLLAGGASADSDGLFCSGETYFALERRSFDSDGGHRLIIIPLSDDLGIGPEQSVRLPDFQAHALICGARDVVVLAWAETHRIDVSDWRSPRYLGSERCSDCSDRLSKHPTAHVTSAEDQILPIRSESGRIRFELRFARELHPYEGIVEHTVVAKLVGTHDGQFQNSRIVYAETHLETID